MVELNGTRVAGKAMDDRACVAAITACLHELKALQHQWDVYAVATVQEETGLIRRGDRRLRRPAGHRHRARRDLRGAAGRRDDTASEIGGGPVIAVGPNFHVKLVEQIKEVARNNEIKFQDEVLPGNSGTDAWAIQVAREGVPTALFSIAAAQHALAGRDGRSQGHHADGAAAGAVHRRAGRRLPRHHRLGRSEGEHGRLTRSSADRLRNSPVDFATIKAASDDAAFCFRPTYSKELFTNEA